MDSLRESLAELVRTDAQQLAVDLIASVWPLFSTLDGDLLRTSIESMQEDAWSSNPWMLAAMGASYRSLGSRSRSAALPWFRTAEKLLDEDPFPLATSAAIAVHHAAALRSLGQLDTALEKAEGAWALLDSDLSRSASDRIGIQARAALQLGLIRLHLGDLDHAHAMLRLAQGLSDRNLVQSELVECLSGLSLVNFFNGDMDAAVEFAAEARKAATESGLLHSAFGAGSLIAGALVAAKRDALAEGRELAQAGLTAAGRSDWTPLAHVALASVCLVEGKLIEGLGEVGKALHCLRGWEGGSATSVLCKTVYGALLMQLGEFAPAVATFATIQPTADHSVCPGRFVASIRYKQGDPQGCLEALLPCEALGEAHSGRSMLDVLLLTAAAQYDLGNSMAADVSFDRALLLAAENTMRAPFLLLPVEALGRMLDRASDRNQPTIVHPLLSTLRGRETLSTAVPLEPLSDRERDIARHLVEDKTISQIASDLFISTNTVKTHVRSIYRKLSANNRKDAVRRVGELGLDLKTTPE